MLECGSRCCRRQRAGLPYSEDESAALAAASTGNDLTAALAVRMPDRFKALVSLPLPHVDASLRELRRGLDELGMIGVNIHCSVLNRPVVEPEFLPIYEELDRRHAVVLFHPTGNGICSPLVTDFGLNAAVGTSLEDTLVALHLIARKIPAQFPNITFIVPHLGGPIAMLLERLDNSTPWPNATCPNRRASPRGASTTTRWATGHTRHGCQHRTR